MGKTPNIIDFNQMIDPINEDLNILEEDIQHLVSNTKKDRQEYNDLLRKIQELASAMSIPLDDNPFLDENCDSLNILIDDHLKLNKEPVFGKYDRFPKLSNQDILVCSMAGVLSVLIDVIFVGTPEVVKIYRGGENFDGSILTGALRKLGNDDKNVLSPVFGWFSDKCKVPYDISNVSGVVTPNNHRLRSFSHDPFFGLLFAVADIILGTTTCINDSGKLTVLLNHNKATTNEKWLAVIYYFGHIISDMCTTRGIPIPGFFLTQFFASDVGDFSIADIAESMYKDGYDVRHLASMSVPVIVKDVLISLYLKLTREELCEIMAIADKEKSELDIKLRSYKMKFIANSVGTIGNAVKFVLPPNYGNPCSLNIVQWSAFMRSGIVMLIASNRNFSTEEAMYNREEIDAKWKELLQPF